MASAPADRWRNPATISSVRFRSLLGELNDVATGATTLAIRCRLLNDPAANKIAQQLAEFTGRISLDQNALWLLETRDAGVSALIREFDHWPGGSFKFAPVRKVLGRLRRLFSILSSRLEVTSERERDAFPDEVADRDRCAKEQNRKLLAYETFGGRSRLSSAPLRHILHTTTRCNLRCLTCFQSASQQIIHHDLADTPFGAILPAVRLAEQVMVAGTGEPLLSRSASSLVTLYKSAGAYVEIITNGTTLSRTSRLLSEIDVVMLSFDGGTKESYDGVRRWGNFERLVARLGKLTRDQRRKICLNFVVCKQNIYTSEDCLKLAATLGLGQVHFQEMSAYLPWHDRMTLDDADRFWFFQHYSKWAVDAEAAGVVAVCQLVPPSISWRGQFAYSSEASTTSNIAAVSEVLIANVLAPMDLSEIGPALDDIFHTSFPPMLFALVGAINGLSTGPEVCSEPSAKIVPTVAELRKVLDLLIDRRQAMMPHCLATYAHILVSEDGTTRSCCKLQSRLSSIAVCDFGEIRNSDATVELRSAHAKQEAPRSECVDCRDPLRFHFLVDLLAEMKSDNVDISRIKKPKDFPVPASIAENEFVKELGSRAENDKN